jgi:hypothetical protein
MAIGDMSYYHNEQADTAKYSPNSRLKIRYYENICLYSICLFQIQIKSFQKNFHKQARLSAFIINKAPSEVTRRSEA